MPNIEEPPLDWSDVDSLLNPADLQEIDLTDDDNTGRGPTPVTP
jgi:hypothetical protein